MRERHFSTTINDQILNNVTNNVVNYLKSKVTSSALNGFFDLTSDDRWLTLTQSKNLSNISANMAVSDASLPPNIFNADETDELRTYKNKSK